MKPVAEKDIRKMFVISILIKAVISLAEVSAGLTLLLVENINDFFLTLFHGQLIEDPNGIIISNIAHYVSEISPATQFFVAFYLLVRGGLKVVLIWGMLKKKMWAYPFTLLVIGIFVIYQIIEYTHSDSMLFIAVTVFDLFVMTLVWHEYQNMKRKLLNA